MSFEADGYVKGIQMTLIHNSDFNLEMTDNAGFADYLTTGNTTKLLLHFNQRIWSS